MDTSGPRRYDIYLNVSSIMQAVVTNQYCLKCFDASYPAFPLNNKPQQGLAAKTKKDGQLPRPALLLLPAHHMHWQSVKAGTRSLWVYVRAEGWPAVASILIFLAMVVSRVCELNVGVLLSRVLSGAISNLSSLLESIPGGSVVFAWLVKAWVGLDAAVVGILRFLNPFEGAAGALRLPPVKVRVYQS